MTRADSFEDLAATAKSDPERRRRIDQFRQAIDDALLLAEIGTEEGLTQQDLAERLNTSQTDVSWRA